MKFSTPVVLAALYAVAIFPVFAQQSAASPAPAAGTYRISGRVVDAHTGVVLARCSVQISDTKERSSTQTVVTSDDGHFSFENLALGKYSLTAARRGYLVQSYEEHDQFSTAIAVGPGLLSERLTFRLMPEAVVSGTITDEAGEPVRDAQVRLFEDQDADGTRTTQPTSAVTTDDRGVYEILNVRPGAYFLAVTARPWYAQHMAGLLNVNAGDDLAPSPLDVAYPTTFYPGVTDQDAATPIPVKGGERLEASLSLAPQQAVRIRVTMPSGAGRGGTSISMSQTIFGQIESIPVQWHGSGEGVMELEGVLPGHYDVTLATYPPGGIGKPNSSHFDTDITSGSTELSEESASGEVTVTGRVSSSSGKLPAGAGILLRAPHSRREQFYSNIDDKGSFSVDAPPGTYEVLGNIPHMYIAQITADGAPLSGRIIQLKAGSSPKLEIVAGSGLGTIDGTAMLGDKPASGVMVLLAPTDPGHNQVLFRRDQSDSDGTFTIPAIIPGRYRLLAIERGWEIEWANPRVLQAFLGQSTPIEIHANDHLKQTVQVQPR